MWWKWEVLWTLGVCHQNVVLVCSYKRLSLSAPLLSPSHLTVSLLVTCFTIAILYPQKGLNQWDT